MLTNLNPDPGTTIYWGQTAMRVTRVAKPTFPGGMPRVYAEPMDGGDERHIPNGTWNYEPLPVGIGPTPCAYCGSLAHIERECDKRTELIHDRLDAEAKRLASETDPTTRVSDWFIIGVAHAANIAYRMETGGYKGTGAPKAVDVTLTHDDANRIFQALHTEANRLRVAGDKKVSPEAINHAIELAEKSRQWLLSMTEPIEGTER